MSARSGLEAARSLVRDQRAGGGRVALAYGSFDLLLPGAIRHLQHARAAADALVVAVLADGRVAPTGTGPVLDHDERMEQVASLSCVDVVLVTDASPAAVAADLGVDVLVVDERWAELVGPDELDAELLVLDDVAAAAPPRALLGALGDDVSSYLEAFRADHDGAAVDAAVQALAGLRVLVVGDLIVDEYAYCRVSGTVTKYPALAAIYQTHHTMAGGGAAIARHVAQLAGEVHYVATVGDRDDHRSFVAGVLDDAGVGHHLVTWPESFSVTKRRYITGGYPNVLAPSLSLRVPPSTRLFEVGFLPEGPLPAAAEVALVAHLAAVVDQYDVVIVADFGHGLLSPAVAAVVAEKARWWAVNAQTNSSNYGFNRITRYAGADFVCIDELEARLPAGDRKADLDDVVATLRATIETREIMVTRGRDGLVLFAGPDQHAAPAIARHVVDAVGAGDAVLACTALCRAAGLSGPMTVFLGACAGAVATGIVGNDQAVGREHLLAYAESALR